MRRRILAIIGLSALAALLFWGGAVFGQSRWMATGRQPGWMMGQAGISQSGPGMMNGGMMNGGMMGGGMMGNWGGLAAVDPLSTAHQRRLKRSTK